MEKKFTTCRPMRSLRVFLVMVCAALWAGAQTNGMQTRTLSLEDCVAIALQHNFTIQISRYNPMIARYTLFGSYGAYDPSLSLSGEHDYNLSPGGFVAQGRSFGGTE